MSTSAVTDEQIIASYRRTESHTLTAREVGLSESGTRKRVAKLRKQGVELPPNKPHGWKAMENGWLGGRRRYEQPR